jgi:hypothetical protein
MEITTPNLDPQQAKGLVNPGFERNSNHVKFESVMYDTREQPRKPGFFSRVLGALGNLAPVAYLAAPFTGGLSILAGAGLQSLGGVGTASQQKHYQREQQRLSQNGPTVVSYPGVGGSGSGSDPTLALISQTRDGAAQGAIQSAVY